MARTSNKDLMLDAAEAVVIDEGSGKLTLDAVAERAGVSKGGVLYHFPTKETLLGAMMDRMIARNGELREEILADLPSGPGRKLKAEIHAHLVSKQEKARLCAAMLASVAIEPKLMESARAYHKQRFTEHAGKRAGAHTGSKDGFAARALLLLAADGLFLLEMLQVSPFSAAQRKELLAEMLRRAEDVADE